MLLCPNCLSKYPMNGHWIPLIPHIFWERYLNLEKKNSFSNQMFSISCYMMLYGFPMVSPWFPHGFPMVSPWFPHGFPMVLCCCQTGKTPSPATSCVRPALSRNRPWKMFSWPRALHEISQEDLNGILSNNQWEHIMGYVYTYIVDRWLYIYVYIYI